MKATKATKVTRATDISTELRIILAYQNELRRIIDDDLEGSVLHSDVVGAIEEIASECLPQIELGVLLEELTSTDAEGTGRNWVLLAHSDETDIVQPVGSYDSFLTACEMGFELLDDQQIQGFNIIPDQL